LIFFFFAINPILFGLKHYYQFGNSKHLNSLIKYVMKQLNDFIEHDYHIIKLIVNDVGANTESD
jgi:hypothetical protein